MTFWGAFKSSSLPLKIGPFTVKRAETFISKDNTMKNDLVIMGHTWHRSKAGKPASCSKLLFYLLSVCLFPLFFPVQYNMDIVWEKAV